MLRVLHELVGPQGMQLMLAGAHKMHIGACVKWLGVKYASPAGCIWVPPEKLARAAASVRATIDGRTTASEYRKLFGFLVSLLFMVGDDDALMHFMEEPLRAGGALAQGSETPVVPSREMASTLERWARVLLNMSGTTTLAAVTRLESLAGRRVWRPCSDAAREPQEGEHAKSDGMGGALYGRWWRIPLTPALRAIPIPVLEFLACGITLITFDDELIGAQHVCSEVDAMATVQALSSGAHAHAMRVVLQELSGEPAYARRVQAGAISFQHSYGPGNLLADAASRGHFEVISELCSALGIEPERIEPTTAAWAFLARAARRLSPRYTVHGAIPTRGRARGGRTEHAAPPPSPPPSPPSSPLPGRSDPQLPLETDMLGRASACGSYDGPPCAATPESPGAPLTHVPGVPHHTATPVGGAACPLFDSPPSAAERERVARVVGECPMVAGRELQLADDETSPARAPTEVPAAPRPVAASGMSARSAGKRKAPSIPEAAGLDGLRGKSAGGSSSSAAIGHPAMEQHDWTGVSATQQARVEGIFAHLRGDDSAHRIGCDDEQLLDMCEVAIAALDEDDGELKGNAKSDWAAWLRYCDWAKILPWRTDSSWRQDREARERETIIWINALLYIYPRMKNAKGRTAPPKPSSALAILRSIRRMHAKLDLPTIQLTAVVRAANKLMCAYRDKHGAEALQPHRKEPLTGDIIHQLLARERVREQGAQQQQMWATLWALLAQTGFRKAEVALEPRVAFSGARHISWDNVKWRIGGIEYPALTRELCETMTAGDMAIIRPPPSKADKFGLRWGPSPIYLPYSATLPICAARELAALELMSSPTNRLETPLFATDGGALRKTTVDTHFKASLESVVPQGEAPRYSVHSFRIYLCTSLAEAGASDARIQSMLRWASTDALLLYKRTDMDVYARWVAVAGATTFTTHRTQHLPRADAGAQCDGARARGIRIDCDDLCANMLHDTDVLMAEAAADAVLTPEEI